MISAPAPITLARSGCMNGAPAIVSCTDWLSQREFDHYVAEFTAHGFTAPLNWYRCFDRNWELTASTPAATITVIARWRSTRSSTTRSARAT